MTVDKDKLKALIAECHYGVSGKGPAIAVANDLLTDCCDNLEFLLAEVEALSKDLESHKRMLLSSAVSIGAIGEALGAEMDDDPSELEGLAAELRKDAERYRFFRDSQQVSDNGDGWSVMYLDNGAGGLGGGVMQADFTDLDEATDFAMSKHSPNKKIGD